MFFKTLRFCEISIKPVEVDNYVAKCSCIVILLNSSNVFHFLFHGLYSVLCFSNQLETPPPGLLSFPLSTKHTGAQTLNRAHGQGHHLTSLSC